jgi:tetratricopeptide (TPR) repeat protein
MTTVSEGGKHDGVNRSGRSWGFPGRPWRIRFLPLLVALLLALLSAAARAADMEGPLGGSHRPGASSDGDYRLERIRFENDGEWLRMTIPIKAPWAHWTLTDPPRIIVDLGQTTSLLSKAPGLYQARLDRGPVRAVRTSQFLYSPLDHRVRITLDLSEVVPYQARRVGDEIQILIPDRGARTQRAVVIGSAGIAEIDSDPAPRTESAPVPAGGTSTGATMATLVPQARRSAPHPDAVPSEVAPRETAPSEANPVPVAPPLGGGTVPLNGRTAGGATRPLARTLQEALDEFGGIAVEPVPEDDETEPIGVPPSRVAVSSDGSAVSGSRELASYAADARSGSLDAGPARADSRPPRSLPVRARATVVPVSSPVASASAPSSPTASVREAPPAGEAGDEGSADSAPAMDPKERSAARLLRQAVLATLRGELKTAGATAERAYGFYAGTASGDQCGFLAREIYLLLGRPADAGRFSGLPALPDTMRLPRAIYLSFVDQYRRSGDLAAVDRVLRQWGPVYSPLPGLGALHYAMGEAFLRAGDAASAEGHLRMVPPGDSLRVPALLLIALVRDRRGERESALEMYREVTALGPGPYQARGLARTADIEFQLGRVREALGSYERLLQSSPPRDEEVWAVYQAGNCHLLLGESESAKKRYETVAKLWPQSFWAPFVKERLEEMTWRAQWTGGNAAR